MCGIFGVVFRDPRHIADRDRVIEARNTLRHRGPDEEGVWIAPGVALAHQRLKVLDLQHGQQPMLDAPATQARFALVYNGEVYNFRDIQSHYRPAGVEFTTRCDTEVVFKALNRDGAAAIDRFNGMFAFGHWDQRERALLLVRDRLGKKPLYWFADDELLVFASELKAILEYLGRKFPVDATALDQFFARGYVMAPRTIFEGIHKLPAGNLLKLDAKEGRWRFAVEQYWDYERVEVPTQPNDVLDALDELLTDAVKIRLVSDVPIGCLLSGGIDSSLITSLAAKVSGAGNPIRAFSIGFDESPEHNELPYAELVAKRHGCQWFSRNVRGGDLMAMIDDVAGYYDEPYGNFTMFSMRQLAKLAREQLVVVLTGQGGDELCAGYAGRYNWVPETAAAAMHRQGATKYAPAIDDILNYLRVTSFMGWPRGREAILSPCLKDAILAAATPMEGIAPFWRRHATNGRLDNVLYTDVKTNLPDYLICLEERMTMSCSLEARNPLLDYRVVNFLLSLPDAMKVPPGRNKWALHELARRYVPAEAIDRPKKGFTPPLAMWIGQNAVQVADLFKETELETRSVFAAEWGEYLRAGRYEPAATMPIFYSLMLSVWAQRYGKYIAYWPGEDTTVSLDGSERAVAKKQAASPWQQTLRANDAAAIGEARWFCQAMGNFDAGSRIHIAGGDSSWLAFLATGSQMKVVDGEAEALVLADLDAARDFNTHGPQQRAQPGKWVLWFVPFFAIEQKAEIEQLLNGAGAAGVAIKGFQAIPLEAGRAVLIARGQVTAAMAAV